MKRNIIFVFFLLLVSQLAAQVNQNGLPFITNYPPELYGASEQNWAIAEDVRGVMYFGNYDGSILQYDGKSWEQIKVPNLSIVRSLAVDSAGTIFVGAVGEFGYLQPDSLGQMNYVSLSEQLDTTMQEFQNVWKTHCIGNKVYFNTTNEIFIFENFVFKKAIPLDKGFFFNFVAGSRFFLTNYYEGLYEIKNDSLHQIEQGDFYAQKSVFSILPLDNAGQRFLVATRMRGLFVYDALATDSSRANKVFENEANDYLKQNLIYHGVKLSNNRFAFATLQGGIVVVDNQGKLLNIINKDAGLIDETITYLYAANGKNGLLWAALNHGIANIDIQSPLRMVSQKMNLRGTVYTLIRHKGRLYAGTSLGVSYLIFNQNNLPVFKNILGISDQSWEFLQFPLPGTQDTVLLVGTNVSVYQIDGGLSRPILPDSKYFTYSLHASRFDSAKIYIGDANGIAVAKYTDNQWIDERYIAILEAEVRDLEEDKYGNLWAGTSYKGVFRLRPHEQIADSMLIDHFTVANGLPSDKDITMEWTGDSLLFLTEGGIYYFDENEEEFLPCRKFGDILDYEGVPWGILHLEEEGNKAVWLNLYNKNENKVIRLVKQNNGEYLLQDTFLRRLPPLTAKAMYNDAGSVLWISISGDLFSVDLNRSFEFFEQFHTIIRQVKTTNDSLLFAGSYYSKPADSYGIPRLVGLEQPQALVPVLEYSHNNLVFEFAAPYFAAEDQLVYSFYLENFDEDWSLWTSESRKEYTNLPENDYVFHVKARNIYGTESQEATFRFQVLPPWYRRVWAYVLYLIVAGAFIWLMVVLNTRRLRLKNEQLEAVIRERTAEIVEKNGVLLQQKEEIQAQAEHLKDANEMITAKNETLELQKSEIEKQNKEITDSIRYAKRIQTAILPPEELLSELLPEHFIFFKPRDIVSGDFYWMRQINQFVVLATADCTGHGVPGAFMSMLGVAFLNEIVNNKYITSANEVLEKLRDRVKISLRQTGKQGEAQDGMDITLCVFDMETYEMQYSGANNPLYLIRKKGKDLEIKCEKDLKRQMKIDEQDDLQLFQLKADKQPIGIFVKERPFTTYHLKLEKGDAIYTFSDGFPDQFGGEKGRKYNSKRFKYLLLGMQDKPMAEQKAILNEELHNWQGEHPQIDDILVIGVKV